MVHFDITKEEIADEEVQLNDFEEIDELEGKLSFQNLEDKLMHSVLENDSDKIDKGKLIRESVNQGLSSFNPDLMFEQMVKNFSTAKQLFGETIIRELTGHNDDFVKNNIKVPEFQREIKKKMKQKLDELKREGFVDKEGTITEKAIELAAVVTFMEEVEKLSKKDDFGEKILKSISQNGDKKDYRAFKKGDRYKDIALKASIKKAIRRNHLELATEDLQTHLRDAKTKNHIIYAIDASGSMKGKKIDAAKKAGVALSFNAIQNQDKVGLLIFGTDILEKIMPTENFPLLLKTITKVRASKETNLTKTIQEAAIMFPTEEGTKHLIIISDAMPTIGKEPENETLKAVLAAREKGITISIIGVLLEKKGVDLAKQVAEYGDGRFFLARNLDELDTIVLQDYYESKDN